MSHAGIARRTAALAWDVPVILLGGVRGGGQAWGSTGTWGPAQVSIGPRPAGLPDADPAGDPDLQLALEGSGRQATFGKHRMRLVVVDAAGRPPGFRRAVVRSAVKFLPWQLAHTAVFQLAAGSTSLTFVALSVGAQLLVLASLVVIVAWTGDTVRCTTG